MTMMEDGMSVSDSRSLKSQSWARPRFSLLTYC